MQSPARQISFATTLLVVIASGVLMYVLKTILLPLCLAGLFSILFRPLVSWLRKIKVPMGVCILIVLVLTGSALFGMYSIVNSGIAGVAEKSSEYQQTINRTSADLASNMRSFSFQVFGDKSVLKLESVMSKENMQVVGSYLLEFSLSVLQSSFLVLLFLLFMIPASQVFPAKLQTAFSSLTTIDVIHVYNTVISKVLRYLTVKTVLNLGIGAATWIVLELYGVDFALLIALLTFLLHYIPNVGSIFSAGIPFLVSLAQRGDVGHSLLILGTLAVVHNVIGNVIEPRVLGNSLDLSPVLVLFSLAFWGLMWGPIGMILSVPIMAVIKTILEAIPATMPIATLMSAKQFSSPPPSSPPPNAGSPDTPEAGVIVP